MTQIQITIRTAYAADIPALMAVAGDTGLFSPPELEGFEEMTHSHFAAPPAHHHWLAAEDTDKIVQAAAYVTPEAMAEDVWNLWFIGVRAAAKGLGLGSSLLAEVEARSRAAKARLMLIETASGDEFAATRGFYMQRGYTQEAVLRDYYAKGTDKIVFRKEL